MSEPLLGRIALVLGVERPAGRHAAVALAEAGADVAVATLTEDADAEFEGHSTANEFWAIGRKGIVLTTDGREAAVKQALIDAAAQLGPVSIVVWHAQQPLARDVLDGLRSDPAIVVIIAGDDDPENARALLSWTRHLSDGGLRANALVASKLAAARLGPSIKQHHAPEPLDVPSAVVYLASDASAAIEGAVLVADEP